MRNSQQIFDGIKNKQKRGAYICCFQNIAELFAAKEIPLVFVSQKKLPDVANDTLNEFIEKYNPEEEFVVNISVLISPERAAAGLSDGMFKSAIIHKDAYKQMGQNETTIRELIPGESVSNKIICNTCQRKADNMARCGKCKSINQ